MNIDIGDGTTITTAIIMLVDSDGQWVVDSNRNGESMSNSNSSGNNKEYQHQQQ